MDVLRKNKNYDEVCNGNFGVVTTPFSEEKRVNYDVLESVCDKYCHSNAKGIVLCGSTAEFPILSEKENIEIIRRITKTVAGRKIVVGGATGSSLDQAARYIEALVHNGCDAALVAPPYYFNYSQDEVAQFYIELDKMSFGIPIVAYNIPMCTTEIDVDAFCRILDCEQIVGMKNSSTDARKLIHKINLKDQYRPEFKIVTGSEDTLLPALASGCSGSYTAFGFLFPDELDLIYQYTEQGDIQQAQQVQYALLPLLRLCSAHSFPVGYKILADILGVTNAYFPQMLASDLADNMETVRKAMEEELAVLAGLMQSLQHSLSE